MYHEEPTQPLTPLPPQPEPEPSRRSRKERRRRGGCFSRLFWLTIFLTMLVVVVAVTATGTLVYAQLASEIEDGVAALDQARDRETFETTRIYDRNGELLWEIFGEGKRTSVPLADMPLYLQQATIAIEDDTFYENIGLDAPSLLAALIANLRNPDDRPVGGSTITQQVVRHIAFDYEERTEVSYNRKTKELILAWMMNREYTKDEILEMYLNEIYYGNLAYGIEAAATTYFGKSASELSLAEASLLAGLPQSPVDLDPLTNLEGAKARQWLVLTLMVEEGFITQDQANDAYQTTLEFAVQEVSLAAPHFAVYVRQQLEAQFGAELVANGGLRVTTTLDMDYQRLAEHMARQHVAAVGPEHNLTNVALVAMKPGTGEILAMLGSIDYHDEAIDGHVNVTLSPQQPGSAMKPLTYAAALATNGADGQPAWTAADLLWDVPVEYPQFDGSVYAPVNYDERFHGPVRFRTALANSYNIPALLLLQDVGVPRFLDFARQMGLTSLAADPSQYGLALTLGGAEVTPLELTNAYGVLANGGYRVPPAAILRVERTNGEVLFTYEPPAPTPVVDPRVAFIISDILDDDAARVPAMGRDNPLALTFPAAAKTGTSNDFRDNWTVGYTPGLVVGVWAGNTDNSAMINISGLTGAAPLWADYMNAVYGDYDLLADLTSNGAQPPTEFVVPAGLERRSLCDLGSITIGAVDCVPGGQEWFLTGGPPAPTNDGLTVIWERLEPAVWRLPAVPLPPLPPDQVVTVADSPGDDDALPPPTHCLIPAGTDLSLLPPQAAGQLFLPPPRNQESLKSAYEWALAHNLPIQPQLTCDDSLLTLANDGSIPAIWRISSPAAGATVSGILPIEGTASFDPADVQFFKIELGMGDLNNPQWVTLGDVHTTPVVNGQLEMLHADALPAGDYLLRLILITRDGNYVGEPHTITITIE